MPKNLSLAVPYFGFTAELNIKKYHPEHVEFLVPYRSSEIDRDQVLLPDNRTVGEFKVAAQSLRRVHSGHLPVKHAELLNLVSQRDYKAPYQDVLRAQVDSLRQRYEQALASDDLEFRMSELRACAAQGHVQATQDLASFLEAQSNREGLEFFAKAHNMGHSEALLSMSRAFMLLRMKTEAIRVLLLGAWCGSVRCAQVLNVHRECKLHYLDDPQIIRAFEEAVDYDSMWAMYLLGYILLHGENCRDEARGEALIRRSATIKHPSPDNEKGPKVELPNGRIGYPAGTLAHLENLIDQELQPLLSKEKEAAYLDELAKRMAAGGGASKDLDLPDLKDFNPMTERMGRRIAYWFNTPDPTPTAETHRKRQRMVELFGADDDDQAGEADQKGGSHA